MSGVAQGTSLECSWECQDEKILVNLALVAELPYAYVVRCAVLQP